MVPSGAGACGCTREGALRMSTLQVAWLLISAGLGVGVASEMDAYGLGLAVGLILAGVGLAAGELWAAWV